MANNNWSNPFDFANGPGGWSPQRPQYEQGTSGTWSNGRWNNGNSYGYTATIIQRTVIIPSGSALTRLEWTGGSGYSPNYVGYYYAGGYVGVAPGFSNNIVTAAADLNIIGPATVLLAIEISSQSYSFIDKITLRGTGQNPLLTHFGPLDDEFCGTSISSEQTAFPIALLTGEKRKSVTDLESYSEFGLITFTRNFRQNLFADGVKLLGVGWTHNHHITLQLITNSADGLERLIMRMGRGGELHFTQIAKGSTEYKADLSVYAVATRNGDDFKITAFSRSEYTFASAGKFSASLWQITSIKNTQGVVLNYSYHSTTKKLLQVVDINGIGLSFEYISDTGNFDAGQISRVTALSSSGTTNRYVQFTYTREKLGGVQTSYPVPLLETARDVRGYEWLYEYYGQNSAEQAASLKNYLVQCWSPYTTESGGSVRILQDDLTYTFNGNGIKLDAVNQKRGNSLSETTWFFQPNGQNRVDEVRAGRTSVYRFDENVLQSTENPSGGITSNVKDFNYRPISQSDANGNATQMG